MRASPKHGLMEETGTIVEPDLEELANSNRFRWEGGPGGGEWGRSKGGVR